MPRTKHLPDTGFGGGHLHRIANADEDGIEPGDIEDPPQCSANGNHDLIVLVGTVGLDSFRLQYADHFERNAADAHVVPDCIFAGKEFLVDARAENRHPPHKQIVLIVEKATALELKATHLEVRSRRAQHASGEGTVAGLEKKRILLPGHGGTHFRKLLDSLFVLLGEGRNHAPDLLARSRFLHRHRPHHQQIYTQFFGLAEDFFLGSRADGTDNHHRSHTHGNACQCQRCAGLMGKQGARRSPDPTPQLHRSASTGDMRAARAAGTRPAARPTRIDAQMPSSAALQGATPSRCIRAAPMRASRNPRTIPANPPARVVAAVSTRNWRRMSPVCAPTARRRPISGARSLTDANIRAAVTMPPTSREIAATMGRYSDSTRSTPAIISRTPEAVRMEKSFG